jgi:rod shape-determining protein MreC
MRRSSIVALVIFAAALLALLSVGPQVTRRIQATFFQVISPFLKTGSGLERQITSVRTGLKSLDELERENAALRVENRSLKATNEALRDVQHEVNRLRHALNYRQRSLFRLVAAEIISRDSSTWWRTVTINRGSEDGLEPEMPVLTD